MQARGLGIDDASFMEMEKKGVFVLCLWFLSGPFGLAAMHVSNFGAVPDDGKDDAPAIRSALAEAVTKGERVVRFGAGRYDLAGNQAGDLGGSNGSYFLRVSAPKGGLSLEGAVDAEGRPATLLMGKSLGAVDQALPTMLRFIEMEEASLRNIIFDWEPWVYSCGEVQSITGDRVTVKVRPGHPAVEGMKPYNLGVYDPSARAYVSGRIYTHEGKSVWKEGPETGTLVLADARLAERVKPGLWVFWFLSYFAESVNLHALNVGKLVVSNVWMHSANGFGVQARFVREAQIDGFKILPSLGRIATTTRDGFRFALPAGGDLRVRDCHFEGVQDDCQSVYSTHLVVGKITGGRSLVTRDPGTGITKSVGVVKGSVWGFYGPDLRFSNLQSVVESSSFRPESNAWTMTFRDDLPALAREGAVICNLGMAPRSYTLTGSTFVNCNAVGSLIQTHHVLVSNNVYRHVMEPGVLIGSATYGEGMPTREIRIVDNLFEHCGVAKRYGLDYAVSLGLLADVREGARIEKVLIEGNRFVGMPRGGVRVGDAIDVVLRGNDFSRCGATNAIFVAPVRVEGIVIENNRLPLGP